MRDSGNARPLTRSTNSRRLVRISSPSRPRSITRACVSLAGPEHKSRSLLTFARSAYSSGKPSVGSTARTSTATPLPALPHTMLKQ